MVEVLFILSKSSLFRCSFPFKAWFKALMSTTQTLVSIRISWGRVFPPLHCWHIGQIIFCCGYCPMHCKRVSSISGLYSVGVSIISPSSCDNQKCLQELMFPERQNCPNWEPPILVVVKNVDPLVLIFKVCFSSREGGLGIYISKRHPRRFCSSAMVKHVLS